MATNETVIEVVKFVQKGLPEITAQTKAYSGEVKDATTKLKVMAGLLNDPRFARHQKLMGQVADATERTALSMRNQALAARLADGSEVRRLRSVQRLNAEYARMQRVTEFTARYGE